MSVSSAAATRSYTRDQKKTQTGMLASCNQPVVEMRLDTVKDPCVVVALSPGRDT